MPRNGEAAEPGKDPSKTIEEGHLHFVLHGARMKGEWLLVRMKPRPGEKRENWLLRKIDDEHAGTSGALVDRAISSVTSGRSMAEIAAGDDVWTKRGRSKAAPLHHMTAIVYRPLQWWKSQRTAWTG